MEKNSLDETLLNIEVFCKVLADKISGLKKSHIKPEPIEKLLRRKVEVEVCGESPEGLEPLIDILENEKEIKILALVKPSSKNRVVVDVNGDFTEIVMGGYLRVKFPIKAIDASRISVNNIDWAFEITIEKASLLPSIAQINSEKHLTMQTSI